MELGIVDEQPRASKHQSERKPGTFLPGNRPPVRREPGTANKITRDLKRGLVEAAERYGSDGHGEGGLPGYLFFLAGKHPKAFASLLGKLMPLQLTGVTSQSIGSVNIVSVPVDHYLSAEDIKRLAAPMAALEHANAESQEILSDNSAESQ